MYRPKRDQGSLFTATTLLPEEKMRRLERTWAWAFRTKALPLINEGAFSHLYHKSNGRPNLAIQTLIGLLVIKEMFDLTDDETLFNLEFHLAYQVALALDPHEAHTCQKTLHNFRKRLIECDADELLFKSVTDKIIQALGVNVGKQRLDSTHIVSNIARLTRLGLFCETIRVFLAALKRDFAEKFQTIPETVSKRYLKEDGTATRFGDAKSDESRRRLGVCARDVYRLVDRFRGCEEVRALEAYSLLERLLEDQCEITKTPKSGGDGDADISEPGVPVDVKEPKKVDSDSLQSPHDPDATYSGHKGKGYEVQVVETYGNENTPEIITHVKLTRSCESDERALDPAMDDLAARDIQPSVLTADTTYGSTANALACDERGTELLSPAGGNAATTSSEGEVRVSDFFVDPTGGQPAICPAEHTATREERNQKSGTIRSYFDASTCERCEKRKVCPARRLLDGTRVLHTTNNKAHLELRRSYEETDEFKERYANRAGIEATNSELKRKHGLGRLRVRRQPRVQLAVYLKAAACNVKRMVNHFVEKILTAEKMAEMALAGVN